MSSLLLLIILLNNSCTDNRNKKSNKNIKSPKIVNCFIVKPIREDSKSKLPSDIKFMKEPLEKLLKRINNNENINYDSAMSMVTGFEKQKEIYVNSGCVQYLNNPDSINLMDLYFYSGNYTKVMNHSIIKFIRSYDKNVHKMGKAKIYEYRLNGVAETEPHCMYIILKDQSEEEQRIGRDHTGIVFCSDGMNWIELPEKKGSMPKLIQMIRRGMEFEIPLYYDSSRFIPIGHYKIGDW
ncbi:hypothetical protein HHL16_16260 [Pseudoflavitalea sp. G-6-1-2]|uniref:hypothetical protein n=1 Tax=Pseudoflavitalea sp. G-6-1-2 TaxID=2728841 RepID=UPI00146F0602|nr:hypothetical protein [Pseudoflavitalea sp. G-6-1-2]NML22439.1 hypothetical protein [Pseudoflavitalea sp. G-6-1-2]